MPDTDSDQSRESANASPQTSMERVHQAMVDLKAAGDSGASWFYWIAGLSLINTAILHSGGERHFIVGLAITAIVDAMAMIVGKENPESAQGLMIFAIGFSVVVSMIVSVFGWLSRKRYLWFFGIGMFFYLLDGLLYLFVCDYSSAAFHAFALYSMMKGFHRYRQLAQFETAIASTTSEVFPMPNPRDLNPFN